MSQAFFTTAQCQSLPLHLVTEAELAAWLRSRPEPIRAWLQAHNFAAERHRVLSWHDASGRLADAVMGLGGLPECNQLSVWPAVCSNQRAAHGCR